MTQRIDQEKLREAAEHLEWVLSRYHEDETMRQVWEGLAPLIERAKRGEITEIIERQHTPYYRALIDGLFNNYTSPNFGDAYVSFCVELRGGYTEAEKSRIRRMRARSVEQVKNHEQ